MLRLPVIEIWPMTDRVRYQYDQLETFARQMSEYAANAERVRTRLSGQLEVLESGGWLGEAAKRFSDEMRGLILPALDRLAQALDSANAGILRASESMRDAENEAAVLFRQAASSVGQSAGAFAGAGQGNPRQAALQQVAALTGLRDEQTRFINDLRRGLDGIGSQVTGVQQAYDRLMSEAAARAARMNTLIGALQGGAAL